MEGCDQNKIFVGGISWQITEDVLREYFELYGKVVSTVIAKDRNTGIPRGFGFVSFSDSLDLHRVIGGYHCILGRKIDVKIAVPRNESQDQLEQSRGSNRNSRADVITNNNNNLNIKKIFVGGLPANITQDEFRVYFEKFGKITDLVVMHDNATRRPRGFGFITFDSEDSVEEVMQKSFHELCGKLVEVKKAVPKEDNGITGGNLFSNYSPYSPRCDLPGYGGIYGSYPYGSGFYGGAHFGGISYELGPWGATTIFGIWGNPNPYPMTVYPTYMNNGYGLMGMAAHGYSG